MKLNLSRLPRAGGGRTLATAAAVTAVTVMGSALTPAAPSAQAQADLAAAAASIPGTVQLPDTGQIADQAKDAALNHPLVNNALENQTNTPEPDTEESTKPTCAPIVLVAVPGTFETNRDHDPNQPVGAIADLTEPLRTSLGSDLSETYINYAADAGVSGTAYAKSIENGATKTLKTIEDVQNRCDNSRVFLTGFSQGADVAGDVATMIGQKQTAINPETMAGVVLFSDPKRTENTNIIADSSDPIPSLPAGMSDAVEEMTDEDSIAQRLKKGGHSNGLAESLMSGEASGAGESAEAGSASSAKNSAPAEAGSKQEGDVRNNALAGNEVEATGGISLDPGPDTHILAAGEQMFLAQDVQDSEAPEETAKSQSEVELQEEVSDLYRQGQCGDLSFDDCVKQYKSNPDSIKGSLSGGLGTSDKKSQNAPSGNLVETECVNKSLDGCARGVFITADKDGTLRLANLPAYEVPASGDADDAADTGDEKLGGAVNAPQGESTGDAENSADTSGDGDTASGQEPTPQNPSGDTAGDSETGTSQSGAGAAANGAAENGADSPAANTDGAPSQDATAERGATAGQSRTSGGSAASGSADGDNRSADTGNAAGANSKSAGADSADDADTTDAGNAAPAGAGEAEKPNEDTSSPAGAAAKPTPSSKESATSTKGAGEEKKPTPSKSSKTSSKPTSVKPTEKQAGEDKRSEEKKSTSKSGGASSDSEKSKGRVQLEGVEPVTAPAVSGGGVAGQREEDFGALTGSVVSMCVPGDIVCSLPENSQLARDLVQVGEKVTTNLAGVAKEALAGNTRMGGLMAVEATNTIFSLSGLPPLKLSGESIMALVSLVSGAAMLYAGDPTGQGAAMIAAAVPMLPKVLPELYEQIKDLPAIIEALPDAADTFARNLGIDKILGRLSEGYQAAGMNDLTDLARMPTAAVSASIDLLNDNSGLMELATNPDYLKQGAHSADGFRSVELTDKGTNAADWYGQYVTATRETV